MLSYSGSIVTGSLAPGAMLVISRHRCAWLFEPSVLELQELRELRELRTNFAARIFHG
jgi:hypothetical protein